jgi:hypothetical protein
LLKTAHFAGMMLISVIEASVKSISEPSAYQPLAGSATTTGILKDVDPVVTFLEKADARVAERNRPPPF